MTQVENSQAILIKYNFIEKSNTKLIVLYLSIIIWSITLIIGYNLFSSVLIFTGLLLNISFLFVRSAVRNNMPIIIILIFMSRYIIQLYYPLFSNIQFGALSNIQSADYRILFFSVAQIQFVFISMLSFFLKIPYRDNLLEHTAVNNTFLYIICISLFVIITYYGKMGEGLRAGKYGSEMIMDSRSSLFEYAIIPFVGASIFSNNKKKVLLLFIVAIYYIVKNTLFGGRIESITILFVIYLFFYRDKIKIKQLILGIFILVYIMDVIGRFRTNPELLFEGNYFELLVPIKIDNTSIQIISSQESEVNYSSTTILKLLEYGFVEGIVRLKAFLWFIISIFIPSSIADPLSNLTSLARNHFGNLGGGLISVNFFIYGGYIGVVMIAYIIAKIVNSYKGKEYSFFSIYSIFVLVTWSY